MEENLKRYNEMLKTIDFDIPNNTSSKNYLLVIRNMIEQGAETIFEPKKIIVTDKDGIIQNGIHKIELFFGGRSSKTGLIFKVKIKRKDTGLEMDSIIEAVSVKKGILSEREELSFIHNNQLSRYDYLREYESDGTCVYHTSRDLAKKISTSAKVYDKGILISKYNILEDTKKSIVLLGNYMGENKKNISTEIKKGTIFSEINSNEGKEVPYRPYPFSDREFESLLLKI